MHAKPEKVARRRLLRRMKAVASVAVAVSAGLFLACQRGIQTAEKVVDAARGGGGDDADVEGGEAKATDANVNEAAAPDAKPDALAKRAGVRDAAVDVREHRKGMPVPDNLLE